MLRLVLAMAKHVAVGMVMTVPRQIYFYVAVSVDHSHSVDRYTLVLQLVLAVTQHVIVGMAVTRSSQIYFNVAVSVNCNPTCSYWHSCDKAKSYIL